MILVNRFRIKRLVAVALALLLLAVLALPLGARAQGRVVRVGWYESPFNATDEFGRRSGYAYEFQQKIAAYTGWTYEYVEGSWPELLQMLIDGKIDLLSDVSYTEERTAYMQYSSLPMGEEEYYIFVAPGNDTITPEDYATFNGKRAGVDKGSIQAQFFRDWCETNGVQVELVELMDSVADSIEMLHQGELDMYISLDAYIEANTIVPVCKIGGSDFYFAVSNAAPELLTELNAAMNRIRDENPYYNQQLYSKYIKTAGVNLFLSAEEKAWLAGHGPIRVGYQDNYLALCGTDPATGELTGALKEYLAVAADCLENATLEFEPVVYPTSAAAMEALQRGEVDCAFPANLTDYDGETQGFFMTPALMSTDMSAVIRESEQKTFAKKDRVMVAVNAGNPNYDMFLLDNYPDWRAVYFHDTQECLEAIAAGKADCLIISNYRFNNIARQCEKLHLTTVSTGVEMDYYLAVNRSDTLLYSILAKTTTVVPASTINAALSHYFTEDAKVSTGDFLRQNLGVIISGAVVILALIVLLLLRVLRSKKKADAEARLISATENDELTGLYNKNYFYEYANQLYREQPDMPMDAIVMNIEQFHAVNAMNGRAFGDQTLQVLADGVLRFLRERRGIAGREEADGFAIYCAHIDDYQTLFDRFQGILDTLSTNARIRLRMGVMPWQEGMEPSEMIEQAHVAGGMARGNIKTPLVVIDDTLRQREALEQRLLNDLRRAVENRELEVWYQPKYDIRTEPPTLMSAEALVRWRHPEQGMIPPGDFIPLLEHSGQIGMVDKFVWAETAGQLAAWRKQYGLNIPISVNLSRLDVFDPTLESTLETLLEKSGLDHGALKLEITESACTENTEQVVNVVKWLRKKGFEIEMDDFGSGYSSLSMLSTMPIDVLKMDRAFVGNIEHSEKDAQLVKLILGLARELNVRVIAEGVETEGQLQILREMGCELVQGYVLSRPLPAAEFEEKVIRRQ